VGQFFAKNMAKISNCENVHTAVIYLNIGLEDNHHFLLRSFHLPKTVIAVFTPGDDFFRPKFCQKLIWGIKALFS
jgi:hypothetical protein